MVKTTVDDFKNNLGSNSENNFESDFEDRFGSDSEGDFEFDFEDNSEEVEDEQPSTKETRRTKGQRRHRDAVTEKKALEEKCRVVSQNYRKREQSEEFYTTKRNNQKAEKRSSAKAKADEIRKRAEKRGINI